MSADIVVAKRYAKALFETAQQSGIVMDVQKQLKFVVDALDKDADVGAFFAYPNIDASIKINVLRKAFADQVSSIVLNLISLVVERRRQELFPEIYEQYLNLANESAGITQAAVYTAKTLSTEELAKIAKQFNEITGKIVVAHQIVAPELLGGIQVRIGDKLYDGSLSGKLERLHKAL